MYVKEQNKSVYHTEFQQHGILEKLKLWRPEINRGRDMAQSQSICPPSYEVLDSIPKTKKKKLEKSREERKKEGSWKGREGKPQ